MFLSLCSISLMAKKTGRPLLDIDEKLVEDLASINCSYEEIATVVGCSVSTLTSRFQQVIQKGHNAVKTSLKRAQYKAAMSGSIPMLIWLGKIILNQRDTSVPIQIKQEMSREDQQVIVDFIKRTTPKVTSQPKDNIDEQPSGISNSHASFEQKPAVS